MNPLQKQVVDTLEAMAIDQGYTSVRSWYDADKFAFRVQLSINEVTFMDYLSQSRRLPQVPVNDLVRKIIARQVGKGLRRYGRRK